MSFSKSILRDPGSPGIPPLNGFLVFLLFDRNNDLIKDISREIKINGTNRLLTPFNTSVAIIWTGLGSCCFTNIGSALFLIVVSIKLVLTGGIISVNAKSAYTSSVNSVFSEITLSYLGEKYTFDISWCSIFCNRSG